MTTDSVTTVRRVGIAFAWSLLVVGLLASASAASADDLSSEGGQNLTIDLRCRGTLTAHSNDQDVGEQTTDNPSTEDCIKPLSDSTDVYTAIVSDPQGRAVEGVRVDFSFGQRINGNAAGPNNSTNDATLSASTGEQIGTTPGGLETSCLTGSRGRCSATLVNAIPQAGDTIEIIAVISGQTDGIPSDGATTEWQFGVVNGSGTLTLAPRAATNQIGTAHTVMATVRNQFGQPVQGANVDFKITAGPNVGLSQAGMTDAVTGANGVASFTYASSVTGTDTIVACSETGGSENDTCNIGEPNAQASNTWQTGPIVTNAVGLDMDADDGGGAGSTGNPGACELTTAADVNRESVVTSDIDPADATAPGNFHRFCAAAFQNDPTFNNGRIAGAEVTFTISGPGRIYPASPNNSCSVVARPPASTSLTVIADEDGYAFACLYSQATGRTRVTASSGSPAQTATGKNIWTVDGVIRHNRAISIGFDHQPGQRLLVLGRLRLVESEFDRCIRNQPVKVQRRVDGRWVTEKSTQTNRRGRYKVEIADRTGKYRALAPRTSIADLATSTTDVCVSGTKSARHAH